MPADDDAAWDGLVALGLVRRTPGGLITPPPRPALERWAVDREQEAARARQAAAALAALHDVAADDRPYVETLRGLEASRDVYNSLQSGAREQVRAWERGSYSVGPRQTMPPVTRDALARGVRYHTVYDGSQLGGSGLVQVLADSIEHGEQARIFPQLPMKMLIADADRAIIALPARDGDVDAVLVHPSLLLDAIVGLFTMVWDMAVPAIAHPPVDGEPDAEGATASDERSMLEGHLLAMLSAGLTDAAIARTLGVSTRTVARRVGALQDRLGARNRFQLAALAARRGWL